MTAFNTRLSSPKFQFEPQGLLNGATKLAYEVGENKSKGGESPYSGTSLNDIQQNVEGIEAVYKLAFAPTLEGRDPKLATRITDKIEDVEKLVNVPHAERVQQNLNHLIDLDSQRHYRGHSAQPDPGYDGR